MPTLAEALQIAQQQQAEGKLAEASGIYEQILAQIPTEAETMARLGFLRHRQGRHAEGISLLKRAIEIQPSNPGFYHNLGLVQLNTGSTVEAIASFRNAIELMPELFQSHTSLGDALARNATGQSSSSDQEAAIRSYERALKIEPAMRQASVNLSQLLLRLDRWDQAAKAAADGLSHHLLDVDLTTNLAVALRGAKRPREAMEPLQNAIAKYPASLLLRRQLAITALDCEEGEAAIESFHWVAQQSTKLGPPEQAKAWYDLGTAQLMFGNAAEAETSLQRSMELDRSSARSWENLAVSQRRQRKFAEALASYQQGLLLDPSSPTMHFGLSNTQADLGEIESARDSFAKGVSLRPGRWLDRLRGAILCSQVVSSSDEITAYRANLLQVLDEVDVPQNQCTANELFRSGCEPSFNWQFHGQDEKPLRTRWGEFWQRHLPPELTPMPSQELAKRSGKPRAALVVTDGQETLFLRQLARGLLLFRGEVELTVVCSRGGQRKIEPVMGDRVRYLTIPSDLGGAVRQIREANLDLLYFWEIGTDSTNYFLPFARLAPVQCTSWGIQLTSGIPAMDYYLSSRWIEPADSAVAASHYSEKLVLFESLLSYEPRRVVPSRLATRAELGFSPADHLYVFAQQPGKLHPDFDPVVRSILENDPAGKLVLTVGHRPGDRRHLEARLAQSLGAAKSQVVYLSYLDAPAYFGLLQCSEVILDAPYFSGVNTTYDAVSLGKGIVTLPWEYQRGRFAAGVFHKMGVTDTVVSSSDEYVALALRMAGDAEFRRELEGKILDAALPLFEDEAAPHELETWMAATIAASRSKQ